MQLSQLEALLAVLEHGSLLAAARALGRRRATLQAQIDGLEAEVGHALLVRGAGGATSTRAGEAFAERARALLQDAAALQGFLDDARPARPLRVALQPGLPPGFFGFAATALSVNVPGTPVELRICGPDAAVADPDVDLICQFRDALPPGAHRTFIVRRYPIRLLASPDYLDRRGRPATIEDLAAHDLITWTGHRPERAGQWPRCDGGSFPVSPAMILNDAHLARIVASSGVGIALVPDAANFPGTAPGDDLVPVLDGVVGEEGRGRVLISERAAASPPVRALVRLAREVGLAAQED